MLIEKLCSNKTIIKDFQSQGLISEELTRADIEIIKRLVVSGIEGILMNLFVRRNIATQGINWRL
jgi:hypothetical protein